MTAVRYFLDEHISRAVASGRRERGIDAVLAHDAGAKGATDEQVIVRAAQHGRVVVTQDADFLRLHSQGIRHAGIAYATTAMPIGSMIRGLLLIHDVLTAEDMIGHVEFI